MTSNDHTVDAVAPSAIIGTAGRRASPERPVRGSPSSGRSRSRAPLRAWRPVRSSATVPTCRAGAKRRERPRPTRKYSKSAHVPHGGAERRERSRGVHGSQPPAGAVERARPRPQAPRACGIPRRRARSRPRCLSSARRRPTGGNASRRLSAAARRRTPARSTPRSLASEILADGPMAIGCEINNSERRRIGQGLHQHRAELSRPLA